MSYEILQECVVCWKCIDVCPLDAIEETEIPVTPQYSVPGVRINISKCDECGLCADVCPVDAIVKIPT